MIYFVRHGESEANLKGLFAGQKDDSMLTAMGKVQAKEAAQKIRESAITIDEIITSSLKRTSETAQIISNELGYDPSQIKIDDRVTEYDMGALTGTPIHKISSLSLTSAENAENPILFHKRVYDCIQELSQLPGNILLVSSAGVGRMIETIKTGSEAKLFYDIPPYPNGSITVLDWIK